MEKIPKTQYWHSLTPAQTASELTSDLEIGLSTAEAQTRLARHGANKLPEPQATSPWRIFLNQFKSVMTILLVAAAAIAFILGDELEAISILIVLLLNALLGFVNEYRAEKSVQALKALTVPLAKVIRDGVSREIPAADLVPGDMILFEAGDRIPADARLVEAWNLRLDESALTGESLPAEKDSQAALPVEAPLAERATMVYTGAAVVQGRGRALVTATGAATEIGKISSLLAGVEEEQTPLQQRLDRLGRYLALVAALIAVVMVGVGLWRGETFLVMLETSLALAIAAVPEGLAAVATIALALGMRRMAKRRAILRRLAAVETLGSTDVICTDKTGTLTQNQMTVREIRLARRTIQVGGAGYEPKGDFSEAGGSVNAQADSHLAQILRAGLLCNTASLRREADSWTIVGDPTEGALVVAASKSGLEADSVRGAFPTLREIPFDARDRRMATIHKVQEGGGVIVFAKGAPESILPVCAHEQRGEVAAELTDADRERLWKTNDDMAGRALRVLALAYKQTQNAEEEPFEGLTLLGMVGMIDPPRPEAKEAIRLCQQAGVRVVMITGDQKATAGAIAREIGITGETGRVVDGQALDAADEAGLRAIVNETSVYARVSPEHKLRIVNALQADGQIVAMTGDGVNDAPALKTADIGVAMGKMGTDVARESADMVLADDNFATIVAAVE
ncbi:MAG: HAD-IC family P-type ATPase, partial [Chloroflexota bacterium]